MNKKFYYYAVSSIFGVIAVMHILRVIYQWEAVIAGVIIPLWVSGAAVLIAGYLCVRGVQFARRA